MVECELLHVGLFDRVQEMTVLSGRGVRHDVFEDSEFEAEQGGVCVEAGVSAVAGARWRGQRCRNVVKRRSTSERERSEGPAGLMM